MSGKEIKYCLFDYLKERNVDTSKMKNQIEKISFEIDKKKVKLKKEEKKSDINIILISTSDLRNRKFLDSIYDKTFITTISDFDFPNQEKPLYKPCIVVGLENIFSSEQNPDKDQENKDGKDRAKYFNLEQRYRYLDSSIWFRYVPLLPNFDTEFKEAIKAIYDSILQNLFITNIAKEFFEFQLRLYKNSYLAPFNGAHSTDITPFKFHSETHMKNAADQFIEDGEDTLNLTKFRWRLLLVDDFAEEKLSIGINKSGPTKKEILEHILNIPGNEKREDHWIQVETCSSISEFKKLYDEEESTNLKEIKTPPPIYDIILLDYLLGDHPDGNGREYSTDILRWIDPGKKGKKNYDIKYQGPLGKFWFFPISVFSFAFMEDIRQMGYTQLEEEWFLARGADPVNTPQLFRYSLFKFMDMQVRGVYKSSKILLNESNIGKISLSRFVRRVFPNTDDLIDVQKNAKNGYKDFLDFRISYDRLKQDKKEGSRFVGSLLEDTVDLDDSFWEHLQHLIYLLAYAPPPEWPKMWDEFNKIESSLKTSPKFDNDLEYLKPIRQYIIDLQKKARG